MRRCAAAPATGSVLPKLPPRTSPHRSVAAGPKRSLVVLFDDDDSDVRGETASCFHQLKSDVLGTLWRSDRGFLRK